jgi:cell division protein FtsN
MNERHIAVVAILGAMLIAQALFMVTTTKHHEREIAAMQALLTSCIETPPKDESAP